MQMLIGQNTRTGLLGALVLMHAVKNRQQLGLINIIVADVKIRGVSNGQNS